MDETMLYPKMQSLYKRDPATKNRTFLTGQWSEPAFGYLKDAEWVWTEKVDGTNVRVIWDGERVTFGGRTVNAQMYMGLIAHLQTAFPTDLLREAFGSGFAVLFGEGFGAKIQKGGENYRADGQGFVLFDVLRQGGWLDRSRVIDLAAGKLECPFVPEVGVGTLAEAIEYTKSEPRSMWGDFGSEGVVLRPRVELRTRKGDRVISKLKVRDFRAEGS